MALLTPRDLHRDAILSDISVAYRNSSYIADQLCPIVYVQKQSDLIPVYTKSHWFRDAARLRAPRTLSQRGGFSVDADKTYFARRWSYGYEIDDDQRRNADNQWDLDRDGAEFVGDKMLLRRELGAVNAFFKTGVWTNNAVGGTNFVVWSDYATSTPLVDVATYSNTIEMATGREANKIAMGKDVWNSLRWHPNLIDTIKYTERGVVTEDLVRSLFGNVEVLIGRAIYTTSPEGTAEASVTYTRVWGKHVLLAYVPERPALLQPAGCYTFVWNPAGIRQPHYIKRMREDGREIDIIEGNGYWDQNVVGADAAVFLSGAVA